MALLTCDFFAETLKVGASMTVVLPQRTEEQIGLEHAAIRPTNFPVLYLLHGLSDDHTAWTRYTSIERYAAAAGLAVVMPAVHRSFYTDEAHGHRYWSFVSEELPRIVARFFAVSQERDDTFVAGLSMGGYGALKLGLTHPERFAAVASLSGLVDIGFIDDGIDDREVVDRVFGGSPGTEADVRRLIDTIPPEQLPALHISCGEGDVLIDDNRAFVADLQSRGIDHRSLFQPGEHEWGLWDRVIKDVIDWLPIKP